MAGNATPRMRLKQATFLAYALLTDLGLVLSNWTTGTKAWLELTWILGQRVPGCQKIRSCPSPVLQVELRSWCSHFIWHKNYDYICPPNTTCWSSFGEVLHDSEGKSRFTTLPSQFGPYYIFYQLIILERWLILGKKGRESGSFCKFSYEAVSLIDR